MITSERHRLSFSCGLFSDETSRIARRQSAAVREAKRALQDEHRNQQKKVDDNIERFRKVISSWKGDLL
jgi:gas vesicle protein